MLMKGQDRHKDKTPEAGINKTEISDLPEKKKFKIIVIKSLTKVRRIMHE